MLIDRRRHAAAVVRIRLYAYHAGQCDPKKCTSRKLERLGLLTFVPRATSLPAGSVLLTPESEKAWHEWLKTAKYKPVANSEVKSYNAGPGGTPGDASNHDTIGMLAIDAKGNLSGACTTSGMAWKLHGRVGDSPIIGAGLYVDNEVGGATSTGVGEEVIRNVGSFLVVELMRQGRSPEDACREAVERILRRKPNAKDLQVGFLAMDKKGNVGAWAIQKGFSYAVCDANKQDTLIPGKSTY